MNLSGGILTSRTGENTGLETKLSRKSGSDEWIDATPAQGLNSGRVNLLGVVVDCALRQRLLQFSHTHLRNSVPISGTCKLNKNLGMNRDWFRLFSSTIVPFAGMK